MPLKKYIKIYWHLIKINLKVLFEYRFLFFTEMAMAAFWIAGYVIFIEVIFLHTDSLAGWTKAQSLLILAFYYSFQTFGEIFYIDSFEAFSRELRRGELDFQLVKPIPSRMMIFLRRMKFQDVSHFIMTIMIFVYAINNLPEPINPYFFVLGLLLVIPAIILSFSYYSIIASLAFWLEKDRSLRTVAWNLRQIAKYPRQIYKGIFGIIFTFFIPFALLSTIPAEVAMNTENFPYLYIFIILTILFYFFSKWIWEQGLKRYSSAN